MLKFKMFKPNAYQRAWVEAETRTATWIRTMWQAVPPEGRLSADLLIALSRSAWVNGDDEEESRRLLRNRYLAKWLGVTDDEADLVRGLTQATSLVPSRARRLLRTPSGITRYYAALRPAFERHVRRHVTEIHGACTMVAERVPNTSDKVQKVARILCDIPKFRAATGGETSILNGITPLVACLDPQRRFPIMNARVANPLKALGMSPDPAGAAALSRLIGNYGLRHAFDLDVWASSNESWPPSPRGRQRSAGEREAAFKSEQSAVAQLAKKRISIRRRHNELTNRMLNVLEWHYRVVESEYDLLLDEWRPGRKLLIEAKTETSGPTGRAQLRQAIGQLFDYRWRSFKGQNGVDLALLTPERPADDVLELLATLDIEALWFDGGGLAGTISLLPALARR